MRINLIGTGGGSPSTMTEEAVEALKESDLVIGADRLLEGLPEEVEAAKIPAILPKDIIAAIDENGDENVSVVFSGDTGFYSGAKKVIELIRNAKSAAQGIAGAADEISKAAEDRDVTPEELSEKLVDATLKVFPGLSSIQMFSAALEIPYQNWNLVSAHGRELDPVAELMGGKPTFFLTGGDIDVRELCREVTEAGLGDLEISIGERLSYEDQKITKTTVKEAAEKDFDPLSVVLIEPAKVYGFVGGGIADEEFIRGDVPMTKRDIRSSVISRMRLREDSVCWDVGAGTGSCSVEMALAARRGKAFAIEMKPEAVELIKKNREKFGAWNLRVVSGKAPDALADLPAPDSVFIGGSTGKMEEIVSLVLEKNPDATIVVSAIALETLTKAMDALKNAGLELEISQVSSAYTRDVAKLHMLMANNPIFLISGRRGD